MWGLEKDLENANLLSLDGYMVPLSFPSGLVVKNPPASQEPQETWILSMGWEDLSMGLKESDTTEAT